MLRLSEVITCIVSHRSWVAGHQNEISNSLFLALNSLFSAQVPLRKWQILPMLIKDDSFIYKSSLKLAHVTWTTSIYKYHLPGPYEEQGLDIWCTDYSSFASRLSSILLNPERQTWVPCTSPHFLSCWLLTGYGQRVGPAGQRWNKLGVCSLLLHCLAHQQPPEIPPPPWSLHWLGLVTPWYPPLPPQHHGYKQLLSVTSFWASGHACLIPLTLPTLL